MSTFLRIITSEGTEQVDLAGDRPYDTELDNFITALKTGSSSAVCTGADAARTMECCRRIAKKLGRE